MKEENANEPLAERLRKRVGEVVDPEISLDAPAGEESSADSGHHSEILARLGAHGLKQTRYRLDGEVARGGMGAILKVWDEDLRRTLAMKVVLPKAARQEAAPSLGATAEEVDPKTLGRFLEEAQVTGQLDHPGIVPVHELGLDEAGHVYFTMRMVRGRELKQIFELVHSGDDEWTLTRALGALSKVSEAMAYAHAKGVIHRDLKPANVMVGRFGEVYVMDWGLARVLGRADRHDLRIRKISNHTTTLSIVASERRQAKEGSSDDLYTMDGDIVGTPAYMSPEQARGSLDELDARTDVYAMGAMLYHLLAGRPPFVPDADKVKQDLVLLRLLEGPPRPLEELAPDAPGELVAICEKAMARDPARRYADMQELGKDLRAFLEHRVVQAYRTGAVAELRKWIERNRPLAGALAAAVLALVLGLLASLALKAQSDRHAVLASEREVEARHERSNVLRLSALQKLEDLAADAEDLWPAVPGKIDAMRAWVGRANSVIAGLEPNAAEEDPGHHAQLAALRARALPWTEATRERDRVQHPRYEELVRLEARFDAEHRAQDVRAGRVVPEAFALDEERLPERALDLNQLAWRYVDPEREEHGHEAEGLALARLALSRASGDLERARIGDTLAWALFANGLDDEAVTACRAALDVAPAERREAHEGYLADLTAAIRSRIANEAEMIEALDAELASLRAEVSARRTYDFADDQDRWWHAQLAKLVAEIEALSDEGSGLLRGFSPEFGWGVERRLAVAERLEEESISGAEAHAAWREATASIRDAAECPAYGGMRLAPQLGLLPIGRDPESGLWEFCHLLSGAVPERGADGRLEIDADSGIVLVLVPGGTFAMGAQAEDPSGPNHDPQAQPAEGPVHDVTLSPYFLSKYEMTQAQWQRFTARNPALYDPSYTFGDKQHDLRHPVERVSWETATEVLGRLDLEVPTEAQWERAARAGTSTAWWTGATKETLEGAANVSDQFSANNGGPAAWTFEDWSDGYTTHAPVGAFRANAFGMHDMLGNVWEWCRDGYESIFYARSPATDPVCDPETARNRVVRGGGFDHTATLARSAARGENTPVSASYYVGVRPARSVR